MEPRPGERLDQSGHFIEGYWGWAGGLGAGAITPVSSNMDGLLHEQALENVLQPLLLEYFPDWNETIYVVEDNHPAHRSANVNHWYKRHAHRVRRLSWPTKFPDLNVQENM